MSFADSLLRCAESSLPCVAEARCVDPVVQTVLVPHGAQLAISPDHNGTLFVLQGAAALMLPCADGPHSLHFEFVLDAVAGANPISIRCPEGQEFAASSFVRLSTHDGDVDIDMDDDGRSGSAHCSGQRVAYMFPREPASRAMQCGFGKDAFLFGARVESLELKVRTAQMNESPRQLRITGSVGVRSQPHETGFLTVRT